MTRNEEYWYERGRISGVAEFSMELALGRKRQSHEPVIKFLNGIAEQTEKAIEDLDKLYGRSNEESHS